MVISPIHIIHTIHITTDTQINSKHSVNITVGDIWQGYKY